MGFTAQILDDVRAQLAPDDAVLKEARKRRDIVRDAAESFEGVLKTYVSGSLAHGTANCPIHQRDKGLDADCGVVLDRRVHSSVGPDSPLNQGPDKLVDRVLFHIRPQLQALYPRAELTVTKRAILVELHEPLSGGEDPTVDLVVGLRRQGGGLWIPNTEQHRWDPSDPETHTELLTAEPQSLRVTRARAIRLAKAENKRLDPGHEPPLCSFNLEAFGLMFVEPGGAIPASLLSMFEHGAADLRRRLTPDPAGLSKPIKVADRNYAVDRLDHAADQLRQAIDNDDDEWRVRIHLNRLWPDFVASRPGVETKARTAARLQAGKRLSVTATGGLSATAGTPLKSTRAFGS